MTYLGGTEWFTWLLGGGRAVDVRAGGECRGSGERGGCVIDIGENWVKQTARNRAEILTAGGPAALTVPVHGYGPRMATRDVRIDNSKRWQHTHWMSIVLAYRNSPFFDHYEERFAPVYERRFEFLADLDFELLAIVTEALGVGGRVEVSENYVVAAAGDVDLRGKKALRRAAQSGGFAECAGCAERVGYKEYTQVFYDRMPFVPGLSVIDLLFCEGPAARGFFLSF